ncbi:MAG: LacI family DNA-binding transcriptional regulator [Lachnospiraceae bacterium]
MAITAKELAKRLGISTAAVSMALNNKPGVSTGTRKKVFALADELGYDFTRHTQPIEKKGSIHFIIYKKNGAIVSETPFFSELTQGITMGCKDSHYFLTISQLYESDHIQHYLSELLAQGCKGILLLGTELTESDYHIFQNFPIPIVVLDTYFESIEGNYVVINNVQGAYLATTHLIQQCKSQPGYLQSSYSISNFQERADGFYKAIRQNGMPTSKSPVIRLSPSMEGAYADMKELLLAGEEPAKCYFADNDLIAAGAMKAFREAGYRIPEDISIVGFDNMPICSYTEPELSTIHVPKQYYGLMAVKRLMELLEEHNAAPVKLSIATSLIRRKSVKK